MPVIYTVPWSNVTCVTHETCITYDTLSQLNSTEVHHQNTPNWFAYIPVAT